MCKVTVAQRHFCVNRDTIYNWIRIGCPSHKINGKIHVDLIEVSEWITSREMPKNSGDVEKIARGILGKYKEGSEDDGTDDYDGDDSDDDGDDESKGSLSEQLTRARIRKERALATKHEQSIAIQAGEFIHRDEVRDLCTSLLAMLKARLESMPGTMADRWAAVTDTREMMNELRDWVRDTEADIERSLGDYR